MPIIFILDEHDANDHIDAKIRDSLCQAFPEEAPHFAATRSWHNSFPAYSALVLEGDIVAAHVGIVDRRIRVSERSVRVAGVQNVFVLPDRRGRGMVDSVMVSAMREAGERHFDFGLLFCVPELEKVYARTGWTALPPRHVVRLDEGKEKPLPGRNIAMYHPLIETDFPDGTIRLCGNDW